jgi:hypothetical protein
MYLFHNTTRKSLKLILADGYLKSSKLTNIICEGSGIYENNPFVYFSTSKKLFDDRVHYNKNLKIFVIK